MNNTNLNKIIPKKISLKDNLIALKTELKTNWRKYIWHYFMIALGCIIASVAVNLFYIHHHLLSGGISGFAMIVYYMFGTPIGLIAIALNIPLFFLAYFYMSKSYCISAFFGMIMYSFALDSLSFLSQYSITDNILLSCIAGSTLYGIGSALIYRVSGSTGGTDIIGGITQKYYSISVSTAAFLINCSLMVFASILYGIEPALYTLVAFFIAFKSTTTFTQGFDFKKSFLIISEHPNEVAESILKVVGRGVTILYGQGAYTGKDRKIIFVVVRLTQVAKIRKIIEDIDPRAFIILQDANDVIGKGFQSKPQ